MEPREKATERRSLITYGVLLTISLAIVVLLAYELLVDLELVAVALLIAVVLRSIVSAVKKIGAPSWMAPIITLVAIGGLGAFLWFVLIPSFLEQAQTLASSVPGYLEELSGISSVLPASIAAYLPDLSNLSQTLGESLRNVLSPIFDSLPHYISSLTEVTIRSVITVILALYMAYDPDSLVSGIVRLIPDRRRGDAEELIEDFGIRLSGWVVGTGLAMLIVGAGAGVGLWIVGVPLASSFGFLAGLLEIIPYFGPIAGALLPTLVALTVSPVKALLTVGVFVLLHLLDANLIQPQILGRYVRLHPVVVIISFLFLGDLLGFVGLLLAIPTMAFLAALIEVFIWKSSAYDESKPEGPSRGPNGLSR